MRKLPIGIQDFENLREDGYIYVDKTESGQALLFEPTKEVREEPAVIRDEVLLRGEARPLR